MEDLLPIIGRPLRVDRSERLEALGNHWEIDLPHDFIEIAEAYGDAIYSDYLRIYGPRTLGFAGGFIESVTDWGGIGFDAEVDLLPVSGGLLLWADTVEGDMLCLEGAKGSWRVAVSSKVLGSWRRYDMDFSDWVYGAFSGEIATDWLPVWDSLPHPVKEFGDLPFGLPMGAGPAGAEL
jgi:hypothetical protein